MHLWRPGAARRRLVHLQRGMKRWKAIAVFALGLAVSGCSERPEGVRPASQSGIRGPVVEQVSATQVIAYYFHGKVRGKTCLKIEQEARAAVTGRFAAEMASERLVFRVVNYDLPENAHFSKDYKLPCPSLVLVRRGLAA